MKHLKITLLMIPLALVAAVSCHRETIPEPYNPVYPSGKTPILVQPYIDEDWMPITKSPSDITEVDANKLQDRGFGLYAFYTGTESYSSAKDSSEYANFGLVLNNREYTYSGSAWQNAGVPEFWPASKDDNLTLLAYAPYDTWHDKVSYDGSVPSIVYDDYVAQSLTAAELSKQRDILWGTNSAGLPHRDVEKDDFTPEGTADIHFRHAVAKVQLMARSILASESRAFIRQDAITTTVGSDGPETPTPEEAVNQGLTTLTEKDVVTEFPVVSTSYLLWRNYACRQTQTREEVFQQYIFRTDTQGRTAYYSVEGKRYLIEEASFSGFNKTGTLVLDNTSAYSPLWVNVTEFDGVSPEYVLTNDGSTVLEDTLHYVAPATLKSNFFLYQGVTDEPRDLLDGYFLYVIPKLVKTQSDQIDISIHYHVLDISGQITNTETREIVMVKSRERKRTVSRERDSGDFTVRKGVISGIWDKPSLEEFEGHLPDWPAWPELADDEGWDNPAYGSYTVYSGDDDPWTPGVDELDDAHSTISYTEDKHLTGSIASSFEGGRAYTITFILTGDKMGIEVVTHPWELEEASFDYTPEINDVIQALTYDSDYVDYADAAGNVYINNRMGRFYFRLGEGKYVAWQASLVGDAAFGFTDEYGNFLLDENGRRVTSIRHSIDPTVMNNIYVKAIDNHATITSRAKLRIYYIDASNEVTTALNLVNLQGVNEWTIVQNAN